MARIAQRAGISTKTLYKVAAGKDDLFQTVVEQRISQVVAGFSRRAAGDLHDQVAGLAIDYARFVLSPEAIATMRILLEEQARFPALGARFVESTAQVAEAFDGALTEVLPPEAVPGGDLGFFARLFRLTILGEQREQLVKRSPPMGETAIAAFASRVVAVLLPR
ncbi:transcriptional regulator, TetR family [Paracoccus aminophilus JCM 7686]|uniref:Transcriptional regulator, TetR family n=2 Tax=Paracoccus aminophilus TaxID=34003 RepID=S5Y0C2_PARAH|nr:transcriptional regulator, TetR family [Paracoccus aminophilus JCM 7686]